MAKLTPQQVLDGLTSRGLPEHVAKGFVMNAIDESGLETGAVEGKPNVYGTRGYGLMQWTNDRRTNLEAQARARGVRADDPEFQLDMIVEELDGPESRAKGLIMQTSTPGEAAAAIVTHFLRPAKEHEQRRRAAYTGSEGEVDWSFTGFEDADGTPNTPIDPAGYLDATAPDRPDMFELAEESEPQPYSSWFEEVGASYQSNAVTASMTRWMSEDQIDPTFAIGDDRAAKLAEGLDPRYHDYVMTAGSEGALQSRLKWAAEDSTRQQKLAAGGWSAVAAGFAAGVADPIPLVAGVATGGLGAAAIGAGSAARGIATGAALGAAENLGWEAVNRYGFQNPNSDPVSAAVLGAGFGALGGALSRGLGSAPEAQAMHGLSLQIAAGARRATQTADMAATIGGPADSAGAARNAQAQDSLISDDLAYRSEVADDAVPYAFGGPARIDVTGQMTTSKNPLTRLLGFALGEEGVGTKGLDVIPDSATARATALTRRMVGNFMSVYKKAEADFLKEQGIGRLSPLKAAQVRQDFGRQVRDYVIDPHPPADAPAPVRAAAENFRTRMAEWHDELTGAGLGRFDKDPHYFPMVSSPESVSRADVDFHHGTMHEFISQAIRQRLPDVDPALLKRMAEGYWKNLRKAAYGIEDGMTRALGTGDRDAFKQALNDALDQGGKLSDEDLDRLAQAVFDAVDDMPKKGDADPSMGNRHLKRRTLMDHSFAATLTKRDGTQVKMRIADLFETDPEVVYRRYARVMGGRVALANTALENPSKPGETILSGIRSENDVARLKDAIIESWRKEGVPGSDRRVKKDVANVDFMYKRLAGQPVFDQSSEFAMWSRRVKDMQFIRLMSNMGLNQIQEASRIIALTGYKAAWHQMPAIRNMVKGVAKGKYQRTDLEQELEDLTGIGVEYLHGRRALRAADDRIGEGVSSPALRRLDQALDVGSEWTSSISLMRAIHDTQQRWATAAISQQMAQMARKTSNGGGFDLSKLSKGETARLASVGMGRKDLEALFRDMLTHGEFAGDRLNRLNAEQWDPSTVSKFRVFVGRYADRLIIQNDIGALSKWMSHPVASVLIQFRGFVFGAWGKATLWALNMSRTGDPALLVMLAAEMALGMATYAVRMSPVMLEEDGMEKFEEKVLSPAALIKNGWARTATASVLPAMIDSVLTATPAGPQFTNARASGSATALWVGTPAVDQYDSANRFLRGSLGAAFSDDRDFTQGDAAAGFRALVPWSNFLPVAAAFAALTKGMPESP